MKKIIFIIILLVLPLASAFDEELMQCVGGDSELCITSLGDEELFFMGPIPSEIIEITGPVFREEEIEEVIEPKPLKEKLFIVCIIFLLLFTLLIILKEDEEEEEKKKD